MSTIRVGVGLALTGRHGGGGILRSRLSCPPRRPHPTELGNFGAAVTRSRSTTQRHPSLSGRQPAADPVALVDLVLEQYVIDAIAVLAANAHLYPPDKWVWVAVMVAANCEHWDSNTAIVVSALESANYPEFMQVHELACPRSAISRC